MKGATIMDFLSNIDFAAIYEAVKKAIDAIEASGVIAKIPGYVDKALDVIGEYLPKVIDYITKAIANLG